jgi:hypothetical protein
VAKRQKAPSIIGSILTAIGIAGGLWLFGPDPEQRASTRYEKNH